MSEQRGLSLPSAPSQTPGLPSNFVPIAFEQFKTLNTKPARAAIEDDEMSWCDGFFPIAPSTLRILPGTGSPIYTAPGGTTIKWFGFGNIADVPYMIALLSNGRIDAYNINTAAITSPLPAATIANPRSVFGFSQWGSQYVIFATDQINGYWLWDGNNAFGAGTLSPFVNLTNSGENYSSSPTITVQTTGSGTGATFTSTLDHDTISLVTVTNPGSGFGVDDFAIVSFSGGGSDAQAIATANLSAGGGVTGVVVTNPGSGYTFATTLSFSGGGGSGATAVANIQNGQIISVTIINPGAGYTSTPSILATDPGYGSGANHISGGSGAAGYVTVGSNGISSVTVNSGGSGYTSVPIATIVGDGTGAQLTAQISGGVVTGITVTNPGQGYTVALVQITGGNNAANANITLMPFGVSGTTVEVYQQHVWVANGGAVAAFPPKNRVIFSAPGSPADFGDGGGAFLATDSFARVGYHSLKQSNGFLYMIGDSSLNYISGVSTSSAPATSTTPAGPPITTFGNQNVDPQGGSPWPSSVQVFSRNIVFANTVGISVSYGGAVTKVSEPLDDFYNTVPAISVNQADFGSAVGNIFGKPVYMLLLPVIDKISGLQVNKLLCWDGRKWFTSQQDRNLTYIASQEINSALTAWGTDGTSIFQLFAQPSTGFQKVAQSKLFSTPAYWIEKTATRLHAVLHTRTVDQPLSITIDNEKATGTGSAAQSIQPLGNSGADVLGPYPVGQAGRMIGVTVATSASNLDVLSIGVSEQVYSTNV
jgi:hypothetical protein